MDSSPKEAYKNFGIKYGADIFLHDDLHQEKPHLLICRNKLKSVLVVSGEQADLN